MADSPLARWYIAELTEEIALEGDPRNPHPNIVHRTTQVIFADSAEDAFEKALSLSVAHEGSYLNYDQQKAQVRYWSLNELNLVDDDQPLEQTSRPRRTAYYRESDRLNPVEVAMLMSMLNLSPGALPN
jgi:hypothetical protein